jgi:hypothetical protein
VIVFGGWLLGATFTMNPALWSGLLWVAGVQQGTASCPCRLGA